PESMNFKRKYIRRKKIIKEKRRTEKLRKRAKEREKIKHMLQEGNYVDKRLLKQNIKDKVALAFQKGIKLCIDCTYEPCMTPKEHNKLAQQICRAYGANRKYPRPASLHLVNYQPDGPIAKACMGKCDGFEGYCGKSLNEANSKKCRALRLPVCEFAEKHGAAKPKNPVLAINQVVDIVLRYLNNGQNWSEALSVVPERLLR
ncbi:tRNA (guanine9-N1)-methyltransferase, partial [Paragonimus westermani]